jgi:hypothetical protein
VILREPDKSRCAYRQHEVSMPGAWATGDVLLVLVSQTPVGTSSADGCGGSLPYEEPLPIVVSRFLLTVFGRSYLKSEQMRRRRNRDLQLRE